MKPNLENYEKLKEIHEIYIKGGYLLWKYSTDYNVEIEDIGVEIKRQGVGTNLIKKLITDLRGNPPKIIFLYTKEANKETQYFYSSLGFERGGEMGDNILYWQFYNLLTNL